MLHACIRIFNVIGTVEIFFETMQDQPDKEYATGRCSCLPENFCSWDGLLPNEESFVGRSCAKAVSSVHFQMNLSR